MKKGISIISLIITIIVLIILASAAIIVGNNTPENTKLAVFFNDITNVQDAVILKMLNNMSQYATTEKNVDLCKYIGVIEGYDEDDVNQNELPKYNKSIAGISVAKLSKDISEDLSIDENKFGSDGEYYIADNGVVYCSGFEYEGITYFNKTFYIDGFVEASPLTIGDLVTDYTDYGKTVSYSANGVTDWKVFYKQTIDDEDYVYLISSNNLTLSQMPIISGFTGLETSLYGDIMKFGSNFNLNNINVAQKYFMYNTNYWDSYSTTTSGKCVSVLLNVDLWVDLKDSRFNEYIIGVVGAPTIEMWVASWKEKGGSNISYQFTTTGYKISNASQLLRNDLLYFPFGEGGTSNNMYWLACNQENSNLFRVVGNDGIQSTGYYAYNTGVRPVVCLSANIPAYWTDESLEDSITLGIKE